MVFEQAELRSQGEVKGAAWRYRHQKEEARHPCNTTFHGTELPPLHSQSQSVEDQVGLAGAPIGKIHRHSKKTHLKTECVSKLRELEVISFVREKRPSVHF